MMMTPLRSKTLLFAFVAFVTSPAVSVAQSQVIEIYTSGNQFFYNQLKGVGVKGYILVQHGDFVQWQCRSGDALCKQLLISFPNSPCQSSVLGPAPQVFCKGVNPSNSLYIPYNTQVCDDMGNPIKLMEDPEFIVDDSGLRFNARLGVGGGLAVLALLGGGFFLGRRWGKAQSS
jgi:hypothetical protein